MLRGFRDFVMRGNAVDLAVAVVLGTAFSRVVTAIVEGVITPLIAAIAGEPNLDAVGAFTLGDAVFAPGMVLTAVVMFLLTAAAVYFLVVVPMNRLAALRKHPDAEPTEAVAPEVAVLTEIRDLLRDRPLV